MIEAVPPGGLGDVEEALTDILHACVHDGASVGFVLPFSREEAHRYWTASIAPALQTGRHELFVARVGGEVLGTVQLIAAPMPNQPHRADIAKLLVHPRARRRGLARALMQEAEARARDLQRGLLTLDTRSGDPSQALYQGIGFRVAGQIPGYCLNPFTLEPEPTTYLYKALE